MWGWALWLLLYGSGTALFYAFLWSFFYFQKGLKNPNPSSMEEGFGFFRYGGNNWARTNDPLLVRQMLSQLSYAPKLPRQPLQATGEQAQMVTPRRIELLLPPWKGDVLTSWPRGHMKNILYVTQWKKACQGFFGKETNINLCGRT